MNCTGQYLQLARPERPSASDPGSIYFDDVVISARASFAASVLHRNLVTGNGRAYVRAAQNVGMQALAIHRSTDHLEDRVQMNRPMSDVRIPLHPHELVRHAAIVNGNY